MSNDDGFESVGDSNALWNPRQTGSKKGGDYKELVADDKSWAMGYYLGCKTGIGANNATIHTIKMTGVGSKAHISGDVDPVACKVDLWGSGVLDDKIANNIVPGQMIRIVWQGLQQPKKAGGNTYHGWDLQVSNKVEPIAVAGNVPTTPPSTNPMSEGAEAPVASASDADDDSDLPF